MKKKRKKRQIKGVIHNHRDKVDFDYLHELSAEEFRWLKKFVLEKYGNKFFGRTLHKKKHRRSINQERYAADNDLMTTHKRKEVNERFFEVVPKPEAINRMPRKKKKKRG